MSRSADKDVAKEWEIWDRIS